MGMKSAGRFANKMLYDYLSIEFSLAPSEIETVFWGIASADEIMSVCYLNETGVRTAVISNLSWSGDSILF